MPGLTLQKASRTTVPPRTGSAYPRIWAAPNERESAEKKPEYVLGELLPGTKYTVVRELGEGGMGFVLEVVDGSGHPSVVKLVHPWLLAERSDVRRSFFHEFQILETLDHPNIVRVSDYGELADGAPFFAMERLEGVTVAEALETSAGIPPALLCEIMRGLLAGLGHAHSRTPSIIHRDLKSDNVFIHAPATGEPCIKLIDFGVASAANAIIPGQRFVGTWRNAAPEQLLCELVTSKSDLYSAGLLLYLGLAGRGPFDDVPLIKEDYGDRREAVKRGHVSIEAPPVRTFAPWVPEPIDRLLRSVLAKDPDDRPSSAEAFAAELFPLESASRVPTTDAIAARRLGTLAELVASVSLSL